MASSLLNPKIAVLSLAYLTQFADPAIGTTLQALVYGLVFSLLP